jgi:GT2 family glycosyltransferase
MNDPAYNINLGLSDAEFRPSTRWLRREKKRPGRESPNPAREPYAFESSIDRARQVLAGGRSFDTSKHFGPGLSVVVLTLEKPELIGPLLDALVEARQVLKRNFGFEMEIIVGDTGSKLEDVRSIYARHERNIRLENGMRYHFSRCNNDLFARYVNYNKVLFLNNDIVFSDPSAQILEMCRVLDREPTTGVVGTRLVYPDGRLQHGGIDLFKDGELKGLCYHPGHGQEIKSVLPLGETQEFPAVTGACLLIRSSLFRECGGFDERYSTEAQDVDLCLKAKRLGWNTKLVHVGKVIHIENATRPKGEENHQDRARFVRKWSGFYKVAF